MDAAAQTTDRILKERECGKMCRFVSDNTSHDEPNILTIVQRDDGDIEFCVAANHHQEQVVAD